MDQGLSIVIPALNEEENIPKLLEQLDHYFVSYDFAKGRYRLYVERFGS